MEVIGQMIDTDALKTQFDPNAPRKNTNFPVFSMRSVLDKKATKEAGHEVFKDVEWIQVQTRGNTMERTSGRVKGWHRREYAPFYEAWKKGTTVKIEGFPLDHWVLIRPHPSHIAALKKINIHSVEQLAEMSEANLPPRYPHMIALQMKAREFLQTQSDTGQFNALKLEVEDLRTQLADQLKANEELKQQVNILHSQVQAQSPVQPSAPRKGKIE